MSLSIGELFVNLGIKGSEKTVGAITGVRKGLNETASSGLAAKAAILAVVYGMEQLMSRSAQVGTGLTNFTSLTGLSARELQQWQYAARQAGVSGEELTGSLKAVQNSMTNMLLGKGAPEGLDIVARTVGFDTKKARDTFYVLEQLQKFARSAPPDVGNAVIKSFGISEGTIAAMRRGVFNPKTFAKAPLYGDKETAQLDKVNVAMSNLGQKVEMAFGHFTAKHGMQLVNDLSKVTDKVFKLAEAFTNLADKLKVFQALGKVFDGWSLIFGATAKGVDSVAQAQGDPKKQSALREDVGNFFKELPGVFKAMIEDVSPETKQKLMNIFVGDTPVLKRALIPEINRGPSSQTIQNTEVNQNLHFQHEGKDHKQTADSVKKAAQHFVRQSPAQGQST